MLVGCSEDSQSRRGYTLSPSEPRLSVQMVNARLAQLQNHVEPVL